MFLTLRRFGGFGILNENSFNMMVFSVEGFIQILLSINMGRRKNLIRHSLLTDNGEKIKSDGLAMDIFRLILMKIMLYLV